MKLIIFTDAYPYGTGEQYLDNELPYLVEKFEQVTIIPLRETKEMRSLPGNVEVLNLHKEVDWSFISKAQATIKSLFMVFKGNKYIAKKLSVYSLIKTGSNAILYAEALERKVGKDISKTIFYSYWFYHWALIISILKKNNPTAKCVSRADMGDIYDEIKVTPFKKFKLDNLTEVYPISNHALNRLLSYDDQYKVKLRKEYLGVASKGINPTDSSKKYFTIVSCSSVRSAKRVDLIAKVVASCTSDIKWIHFGDGPEMKKVQDLVVNLPSHIKVELKGFVQNTEVLDFYLTEPIALFINISTEEGLPVSLMEAISYGIPVLGTNVYGTPEIVNEKTGILVEVNESESQIASKIDLFLENNDLNREEIIRFWKANFCAEENYNAFSNGLLQL